MIPDDVAAAAAKARAELSGRVLAVTLRSVGDPDIAEEATAEAFLPRCRPGRQPASPGPSRPGW